MFDNVFFKPDGEFLQWLVKEIGEDDLFVDIGCGSGKLTEALFHYGARGMGIDKYSSINWQLIKIKSMEKGLNVHLIEGDSTNPNGMVASLSKAKHKKTTFIFARPCHGLFVEKTIDVLESGSRILYITLPKNIIQYDDLGKYDDFKTLLDHKGTSVDGEIVYEIIKP